MCDLKKEEKIIIENKVNELIKDIKYDKVPYVDIVSIVEKDGFTVETHEMDIETTGCLFVDETPNVVPKRIIWVNKAFKNPDNEEDVVFKKSRFITAHEYGHFKLHHSMRAHRDTYHRTEQNELEADYFARSILMPLQYFNACYKLLKEFSNGDELYTVDMLSRFFRVTRNKVKMRIKDLGELLV